MKVTREFVHVTPASGDRPERQRTIKYKEEPSATYRWGILQVGAHGGWSADEWFKSRKDLFLYVKAETIAEFGLVQSFGLQ